MIRFALFLAAILACATYAFKVGGKPERLAIVAQVVALGLTVLTRYSDAFGSFAHLILHWLAVDSILLISLVWIALLSNRLWPMVLAGLQLAAIFAHLVKIVYPDFQPMSYALLLEVWSWPMLLTTAIGIRKQHLRKRSGSSEADWKPSIVWTSQPQAVIDQLKRLGSRPRSSSIA